MEDTGDALCGDGSESFLSRFLFLFLVMDMLEMGLIEFSLLSCGHFLFMPLSFSFILPFSFWRLGF